MMERTIETPKPKRARYFAWAIRIYTALYAFIMLRFLTNTAIPSLIETASQIHLEPINPVITLAFAVSVLALVIALRD